MMRKHIHSTEGTLVGDNRCAVACMRVIRLQRTARRRPPVCQWYIIIFVDRFVLYYMCALMVNILLGKVYYVTLKE